MRYTSLILSALFASLLAHAQPKRTVVCGRFDNTPPKAVTMQFFGSTLDDIEGKSTKLETELNGKNNFKFIVFTDEPLNFHLLRDGDWIFYNKHIGPGDSLDFVFTDSSISFEGNCEPCIGFQFALDNRFDNRDSVKLYQHAAATLTPYAFAEYMKKRRDSHIQFFEEYFKGKDVPALFKKVYYADEDFDYAINMVQYSWRSQHGKKALLDTAFVSYLNAINVNYPEAFLSHRYEHLLRELPYGFWRTFENAENKPKGQYNYYRENGLKVRDSIAKKYFTGKQYDYALYHILNDQVDGMNTLIGAESFDEYYKKTDSLLTWLGKGFSDKSLYNRLRKRLLETKEKNKPAPNFTAHDLKGNTVKLSDYKGKVVYIDFWATNCAPCVAELPHIKKMQEKYKDNQDLVLLYVSFDKQPLLEKFLKEKGFEGMHWIDSRGFASEAANKYNISGIPRYILVDKKGLLVTKDAPRPSSNPSALIDKILEQ